MTNLLIPDVSEFQGTIAWRTLAATYPAAIIRAHNGWRADMAFKYNATVGVPLLKWWAAYQYLPASVDAATARVIFDKTVAPYKPDAVILDLEEGTGDQSSRAKAWLAAGDGEEILYSGLYFMRTHGLTGVAVPKWIAAYGQGEPTDAHELWQFTDKQTFPGIAHPCDASIFHGTVDDLIAMTTAILIPTSGGTVALTQADANLVAAAVWAYYQPEGMNPVTMIQKTYDWTQNPPATPAVDPAALAAAIAPLLPQAATIDPTALVVAIKQALSEMTFKAS